MLTGPVLAVAAAGELAAGRRTDRPGGGGGGGRRGVQAEDALPLPPSPAYHAQVRSNFKTSAYEHPELTIFQGLIWTE